MSQQSILEKSLQIRNETQEYANTRGRVANVLDDLNNSKPDTEVVEGMIEEAMGDFDMSSKIDKPVWSGSTQFYFVKSDPSNDSDNQNLQIFTLEALRAPYWTGTTFANSSIFVSSDAQRIGIGAASVSERLEVSGNIKANALILPVNSSSPIANRLRSDGSILYYANSSSVESALVFSQDIIPSALITTSGNITSETLSDSGMGQHSKNIQINNGATAITVTLNTVSNSRFIVTYVKLGTGNITFTSGAGATVTAVNGTLICSGLRGSKIIVERVIGSNEFLVNVVNL